MATNGNKTVANLVLDRLSLLFIKDQIVCITKFSDIVSEYQKFQDLQ
jgi:hypothetical protein